MLPLDNTSEIPLSGTDALPESCKQLWEDLLQRLEKSGFTDEQIAVITIACKIAERAHRPQTRKSGEPYIIHPLNVGLILARSDADHETICAGLMHDVLEDTEMTLSELSNTFGPSIAKLVEGATKLNKLSFTSKRQQQAENFRKLFLAIAADIRVVLIKLADRLHNMQTLDHMQEHKQLEIAQETLDIFAPLANRFGLGHFKWQLEDLAFKYLNPIEYLRIQQQVNENRTVRDLYIDQMVKLLGNELAKNSIKANISGRAKHFYSIFTKQKRLQTEEIYDLLAIRILVDKERQCYEALGVIHELFRPIPGRFKDYIAIPKSNMYQSLHTTVLGSQERLIEVQIRTHEMHRIAEYGVAAHWKYKESGMSVISNSEYDSRLSFLRSKLLEMQTELPDAAEYKNAVQIDLFSDEIFVFSPKGDVYCLPKYASPIDFAYYVHSEIGNHCIGARVNERLVPLNHELKNGDVVEIQTSKHAHPSPDWLTYVKSSSSKSKIKQWFKKYRRADYIKEGFNLLVELLTRTKAEEFQRKGVFKQIAQKLGMHLDDDLYVAIASGEINPAQIQSRLRQEGHLKSPEAIAADPQALPKLKKASVSTIQSLKTLMHSFAKCCQPVPGEKIIGVIARGRGVVIHRSDCPNLKGIDAKRFLEIAWESSDQAEQRFATTLEVECVDRIGISRDVLDKIANAKLNILDVRVLTRPTRHTALIRVSLEVSGIDSLDKIIASIHKLSDVLVIRRYTLQQGRKSHQ